MRHLISILLISITVVSLAQNTAYSIFEKSYIKIKNAKTMKYYNVANERINVEYIKDRSLVKVNRTPFKVYLFQEKEGGSEILYNSIINKEKAIINPGKFPYLTLHLSPYGSIMRNKTHHTIFQADIIYTYKIINYTIKNKKRNSLLNFVGKVKIDNKILYKIELINKDCKKYQYKIKPGEDIVSIAKDKRLGAYKILELNPTISFYTDVKPGDIITIPNYYSKSMTIYIDVNNYLPYYIKVFDSKGLYESYKFEDLELNVNFHKDEFLEDFKDYQF